MNKLLGSICCVLMLMAVAASPASAAFPGGNGLLAVQPLTGRGVVLVNGHGGHERRICTQRKRCGSPRHPRWSPDGRALVFSGRKIRLIYSDGSCLNCTLGVASSPAFTANPTLITLIKGGTLLEEGVDGIHKPVVLAVAVSNAVWSSRGQLAVVRHGKVWAGSRHRLRLIGPGSAPSWAPGGDRLALARDGWILVVGVRHHAVRRLVPGRAPAWSPDGKSIAFIGAGHHVLVVPASGGRARPVGRVRGVAVDWQPIPKAPVGGCVAPPGSQVLASSSTAVVTSDSNSVSSAYMGCLRADGRERYLERFTDSPGLFSYGVSGGTVGDSYAALTNTSQDLHYGGFSDAVLVFDLRTGAQVPGMGGESAGCSGAFSAGPCNAGIDQVVVGAGGVSAAHVTTSLPPGSGSSPLVGISCPSASLCVAVDFAGRVFTATDPTGGAGAWKVANVPGLTPGLGAGVSCPSVALCVGVAATFTAGGPAANIYTSTAPTGGAGAWTPTYVVSGGNYALSGIACPSASLCVAITDGGNVITSTNPTGGAGTWTATDVEGTNRLTGVSCSSVSLCVVTDSAGHVITSTNPTGGAGAWHVADAVATGHVGPQSVSCPSSTLCVGVGSGSAFSSTNPTGGAPWTATSLAGGPQAVTCPSTSLCLAVGAGGILDVSTNPAAGAWTSAAIDNQHALQSIACASSSLCVAGDAVGHLVASSNAAGGSAAWIPALVDGSPCSDGTSCMTEQIVASDSTGLHTLDASAHAAPGSSLTALNLSGLTLSWLNAGVARSATLH